MSVWENVSLGRGNSIIQILQAFTVKPTGKIDVWYATFFYVKLIQAGSLFLFATYF